MKNKNIYLLIGIGLLFIIAFQLGYIPFLGSVLAPNDGYTLIGTSGETITGLNCLSEVPHSNSEAVTCTKYSSNHYSITSILEAYVSSTHSLVSITGNDFALKMYAGGSNLYGVGITSASVNENLKNRFFRTTVVYSGGRSNICLKPTLRFQDSPTNPSNLFNIPLSECVSGSSNTVLVELIPIFGQQDIYSVVVDGQNIGEVQLAWSGIYFNVEQRGTGGGSENIAGLTTTIYYPRYKEIFSCELKEGEHVFYEPIEAGRSISLFNLRYYKSGESHFCAIDLPATVVSETEAGATSTSRPYYDLIAGKIVTIPNDQVWGLFYIGNPSKAGLTTRCDAINEVFNVGTGNCVNKRGITTVCSGGVFDPVLGTCVVETSPTCIFNGEPLGFYDTQLKKCVYIPPIEVRCPPEAPTYDPNADSCVAVKSVTDTCPIGTDQEKIVNGKLYCYKYGVLDTEAICPPGVEGEIVAYNNQLICRYVTEELEVVETNGVAVCPPGIVGTIKKVDGNYICEVTQISQVVKKTITETTILDDTTDETLVLPKQESFFARFWWIFAILIGGIVIFWDKIKNFIKK